MHLAGLYTYYISLQILNLTNKNNYKYNENIILVIWLHFKIKSKAARVRSAPLYTKCKRKERKVHNVRRRAGEKQIRIDYARKINNGRVY